MSGMFKTHPAHFKQIRAVVAKYGICYFHGDGNMFTTEQDSNFRKDFTNPKEEASKYRAIFRTGDHIPDTEQEMEAVLMATYNREKQVAKAKEDKKTTLKSITVDEPEESDVDPRVAAMQEKEAQISRLAQINANAAIDIDAKHKELDDKLAQLKEMEAKVASDMAKLDKTKNKKAVAEE
jgi:hypothetical protein